MTTPQSTNGERSMEEFLKKHILILSVFASGFSFAISIVVTGTLLYAEITESIRHNEIKAKELSDKVEKLEQQVNAIHYKKN